MISRSCGKGVEGWPLAAAAGHPGRAYSLHPTLKRCLEPASSSPGRPNGAGESGLEHLPAAVPDL